MNHRLRVICWSCVIVSLFVGLGGRGGAAELRAVQAHVQAGEHGQAVLLSRLNECYAVTPEHVMGGDLFATLTGASNDARLGDGDLLQTFGYDLSVLRVTGDLAHDCGGPIESVSALDDLLAATTTAAVSSVNPDGSLSRRSVTITDVGLVDLRVRPNGASDQLFKGLSGSPLVVGDRTVGLLMSVDPETGEGRALRFDRAVETLRPFFGLSVKKRAESGSGAATATGTGSGVLELRVASWSVPPLDADSRAGNLTVPDRAWLARSNEFPIELVLELPGSGAQTLSALRLVGAGVDPPERLVRDLELLVSSSEKAGRRGWVSVSSATYFKSDADKLLRFAPVRARRIMLRIYSHWGDPQAVGLSGIEIPASH